MKTQKMMAGVFLAGALVTLPVLADETRRVEGLSFRHIDVMGAVTVEVSQGAETELQLRGTEKDLDLEPFYLKGDRLVLGASRDKPRHDFSDVKYRVVLPQLLELHVKGSGEAYVRPLQLGEFGGSGEAAFSVDGSGDIKLYDVKGAALKLSVKGSGDIKAADIDVRTLGAVVAGSGDLFIQSLQAQDAELVVTGSGDIHVTEASFVEDLEVNIVGSGDMDLRALAADNVEAAIVGSGSVQLGAVSSKIDATILGSGDVVYGGDPEVESVELGSGESRSRE